MEASTLCSMTPKQRWHSNGSNARTQPSTTGRPASSRRKATSKVARAAASRAAGTSSSRNLGKSIRASDPEKAAHVVAILGLGRSLALEVVAEGVETDAQRAFLESNGCTGLQGYLLSPPLAAAEVPGYLASTEPR